MVGVSALLLTLMGGGNLAQSSKITTQREAKSWKLFVDYLVLSKINNYSLLSLYQ